MAGKRVGKVKCPYSNSGCQNKSRRTGAVLKGRVLPWRIQDPVPAGRQAAGLARYSSRVKEDLLRLM